MSMLAGLMGGGSLSGSGGAGGQSGPATSGGGNTGQSSQNIITAGGGLSGSQISQIATQYAQQNAANYGAYGIFGPSNGTGTGISVQEIALALGIAAIIGLVAFAMFEQRG